MGGLCAPLAGRALGQDLVAGVEDRGHRIKRCDHAFVPDPGACQESRYPALAHEDQPQVRHRTSAATWAQSAVCQMPRSFSRKAGLCGRTCACCSSRRGKVSEIESRVVSTVVSCGCHCVACCYIFTAPDSAVCASVDDHAAQRNTHALTPCAVVAGISLCDDSKVCPAARVSFQGQFAVFRYCSASWTPPKPQYNGCSTRPSGRRP